MPRLINLFSRWSFLIRQLLNLSNPLSHGSRRLVGTRVKNPWLNLLTGGEVTGKERQCWGGGQVPRATFMFPVGSGCGTLLAFLAWMADCSYRRLGEREI